MVITETVEDAVKQEGLELVRELVPLIRSLTPGGGYGDRDVSEMPTLRRFLAWEAQNIRRLVLSSKPPIEVAQLLLTGQPNRQAPYTGG